MEAMDDGAIRMEVANLKAPSFFTEDKVRFARAQRTRRAARIFDCPSSRSRGQLKRSEAKSIKGAPRQRSVKL
jgi:hypothetical protein